MNATSLFKAPWAPILVSAAIQSVFLLTGILAVVACMRRSSAALRHLVLFLGLASLAILPLLTRTLPRACVHLVEFNLGAKLLVPEIGEALSSATAAKAHDPQEKTGLVSSVDLQPWRRWFEFRKDRLAETASLPWSFAQCLTAAWLAGVVGSLVRPILGFLSLRRLRREARVIDSGPLAEMLLALSRRLRFPRQLLLLTHPHRRMPMTWGFRRPKILVPLEADDWPVERQRVVLRHELAHAARGDFLIAITARLICAAYWFNPLVWVVSRRLDHEQEQACDDVVLRDGAGPDDYAEAVLELAAGLPIAGLEEAATAMARPSGLEGRLLAILDPRRNRSPLSGLGALATALAIVLAVVPVSLVSLAQDGAASAPAFSVKAANTRGLVAWWRGAGDGKDSAGNHDGTFPFGVRYVGGPTGKAFDFSRSYAIEDQLQRVSIPDSPDFQLSEEMTLQAWVYPLSYGGTILLRGDDRPGYDTWSVNLMNPGFVNYSFNTADNQSAGIRAPIQLHQLQQLTVTFDRGVMKLYINGVLLSEGTTDLRPIAVLDPHENPAIGIGNAGGKHYNMPFDGIIADVRIYNRALSEAEIGESLK